MKQGLPVEILASSGGDHADHVVVTRMSKRCREQPF